MNSMVIVAGHVKVAAAARATYLADCADVVKQARIAQGCLDFSISADLVDTERVNIYERWESREAVEDFRGSGPDGPQQATIVAMQVTEFAVSGEHEL